jgi:hypothetical protein
MKYISCKARGVGAGVGFGEANQRSNHPDPFPKKHRNLPLADLEK